MPEWIIAMFLIGALLSAGDMAKIFLEARRSRREAAVYDNHPQKLQMEHYADSFRVLAESFYQMPSKSVMPETGRVDKILEKEQQEVCSRCAKASWCWEQYGNLTRERCQELLQTIADGDEDEISRAKGEWNASCLNGSRFLELFWNRYQQERQTALWSGRVAESRRVVAEQLSEVAGIMDRAACDLYSLNSLPDELSEKICRQMKKNGAFVQKIWLQERPKEHLQIYMTVKAGRHCRITLRQTAELIGSLCGIPMVAVRDGAQVLSGEYQTVLFQEDVKFQVLYGVGRITKPGLQMPVGEAAINLVPRRMIREQIEQVRQSYPQWESVGLRALVEIPQGVQLAAKTYNPRLGIEGGISVLGTSGIVEPMSEQALTDSIRLELSILQKQGHRCVLITPGNYGKAFLSGETIGGKSDFHALAQMADRAVKCSNFVGDTLDMCVQQGFSHALLVGHIGKFSKLAAGVMNTHSRYADARLEVFTAHAALAGADRLTLQQLMSSVTTDEAIACLDKAGIRQPVLRSILQKIQDHVQARAGETMKTGVILFSNVYGYLGETDGCREILQQVLQEYEQERNDDDGR